MPEEIAPPLSPNAPQPIKLEAPTDSSLRESRLERMKKRTVLSDCIVMLRYALDEGCALPDALIANIATIDTILIEAGEDPLSERPFNLRKIKTPPADPAKAPEVAPDGPAGGGPAPKPPDAAAGGEKPAAVPSQATVPSPSDASNPDQLLLRIHNGLSALVAPATAISLRATDPDVVKYGLPWIAQIALVGAMVSTLIFIIAVSNPRPDSNAAAPSKPAPPASSSAATPTPTSSPTATP